VVPLDGGKHRIIGALWLDRRSAQRNCSYHSSDWLFASAASARQRLRAIVVLSPFAHAWGHGCRRRGELSVRSMKPKDPADLRFRGYRRMPPWPDQTQEKQAISDPPRYLSLSTLAAILDVGDSTIEGWVAQGKFPPPKRIGPNRIRRWSWNEVQEHIEGPQVNEAIDQRMSITEATRRAIQKRERQLGRKPRVNGSKVPEPSTKQS
jgi:predicted DNA-binding transcriptional regulator AlpA